MTTEAQQTGPLATLRELIRRLDLHTSDPAAHAAAIADAIAEHEDNADAHGQKVMAVTFLAPVAAGVNWTMPTGENEFPGNTRFRTKAPLAGFTQAMFGGRLITGLAGAKLRLQYSVDQSAWSALDGATGPQLALDTNNSTPDSGWVNLAAPAKADVYLRALGVDGNGATALNFGLLVAYFR